MKLCILNESTGNKIKLYRTDPGVDASNIGQIEKQLKSGKYKGRYFTSSPHDAAIYYPNKVGKGHYTGFMIEVETDGDGFTVDGNDVDNALVTEYDPDIANEALQTLKRNKVPPKLIEIFKKLVKTTEDGRSESDLVAHYNGVMTKDKFQFLKEVFPYLAKEHLTKHGQVALLDRKLRPDEFKRIIPYTMKNGKISFNDVMPEIPIKKDYLQNYDGSMDDKYAQS